ncbi:MAG: c-type cytochrome, partial [Actinobacteria bacterium]|nr:c-type cytochrome [Actinomycetota bacterium]
VMVHQLGQMGQAISIQEGGYGGATGRGIVQTGVYVSRPDGTTTDTVVNGTAALPVDVAVSSDGNNVGLVAAGSDQVFIGGYDGSALQAFTVSEEPMAIAFSGDGHAVVQTRLPAALTVIELTAQFGAIFRTTALGDVQRPHTGHAMFHSAAGVGLACASCHPEGRDDGRVWEFEGIGARRTQTVAGGVLAGAPFHWAGELKDFGTLVKDVLVERMLAVEPPPEQMSSLASWVDAIPAPITETPVDAVVLDSVERGREIFEGEGSCAACHSGARFTNDVTVDVGTGGEFQVPSLVGIADRAPFLHDGCAETLEARFGSCGGDRHGNTQNLDSNEIGDLVAYLETL